jgi:hypothetical protein
MKNESKASLLSVKDDDERLLNLKPKFISNSYNKNSLAGDSYSKNSLKLDGGSLNERNGLPLTNHE